jgi:hypothetical protein
MEGPSRKGDDAPCDVIASVSSVRSQSLDRGNPGPSPLESADDLRNPSRQEKRGLVHTKPSPVAALLLHLARGKFETQRSATRMMLSSGPMKAMQLGSLYCICQHLSVIKSFTAG